MSSAQRSDGSIPAAEVCLANEDEPIVPRRFESTRIRKTRNRMALIAVDDAVTSEAYRRRLGDNGFSAMTVESANDLLETSSRLLPGFAIVDMDTPHFGGLNLARRLRTAGSDVLLVGLMRAPTTGLDRIAKNAGFDAVISKASAHETLVTKLLSLGGEQAADAQPTRP